MSHLLVLKHLIFFGASLPISFTHSKADVSVKVKRGNLDIFYLHYTGNKQSCFPVSNTHIYNKCMLCETCASIASVQSNWIAFVIKARAYIACRAFLKTTVLIALIDKVGTIKSRFLPAVGGF